MPRVVCLVVLGVMLSGCLDGQGSSDVDLDQQALSSGLIWHLKSYYHKRHRPPPCADAGIPAADAETPPTDTGTPPEPDAGTATLDSGSIPEQPGCGWTTYDTGLSGSINVSVLFDPRVPGTVYAANGGWLWQSLDDGATWHRQSLISTSGFSQMATWGSSPKDLIATTSAGVIRSVDFGRTWTQLSLFGLQLPVIAVSASQPLRVYTAANGSGVFESDNGGIIWSGVGFNYPYGATLGLSVDPRDPETLLSVVRFIGPEGGFVEDGVVTRSTNGGASWTTVLSGAGFPNGLARCAVNPNVLLAAMSSGVAKSIDGGLSWSVLPLDLASGVAGGVAINPQNCDEFYVSQESVGPRRTLDGGASFGPPLVSGLEVMPTGSYPGAIDVSPTSPERLLLSTHGGLYTSVDAGLSWLPVSGLLNMFVNALSASPSDPGRVWLASWGSGVWTRPGASEPWQRVPISALPVDYAVTVAADPYMPDRLVVGSWGAMYQSNDGSTFSPHPDGSNVPSVAYDPSDPGRILVATQLNGILESETGGDLWVARNNGIAPWPTPIGTTISVRRVAIDPLRPDVAYAGTDGRGVYRTRDHGASWQSIFAPEQQVPCLLLVPGAAGDLYACVLGIQHSADGGDTWTDVSQGLTSLDVHELVYDPVDGAVYATSTGGVFVKRGQEAWTALDEPEECQVAAGAATIVRENGKRTLLVGSAGSVLAHAL